VRRKIRDRRKLTCSRSYGFPILNKRGALRSRRSEGRGSGESGARRDLRKNYSSTKHYASVRVSDIICLPISRPIMRSKERTPKGRSRIKETVTRAEETVPM